MSAGLTLLASPYNCLLPLTRSVCLSLHFCYCQRQKDQRNRSTCCSIPLGLLLISLTCFMILGKSLLLRVKTLSKVTSKALPSPKKQTFTFTFSLKLLFQRLQLFSNCKSNNFSQWSTYLTFGTMFNYWSSSPFPSLGSHAYLGILIWHSSHVMFFPHTAKYQKIIDSLQNIKTKKTSKKEKIEA
jgi:hypothetical protein